MAQGRGRHAVPRPGTSPARVARIVSGARGLPVSLRSLFQYQLVQRQLGDRALQTGILCLEVLQATGLTDLQPAIFPAPAVVRLSLIHI